MQTQEYRYKEDPETSGSILVQQTLNQDQDAFEALVSHSKQSLFGLINNFVGEYHETENILQQGMLQPFSFPQSFQVDKEKNPCRIHRSMIPIVQ